MSRWWIQLSFGLPSMHSNVIHMWWYSTMFRRRWWDHMRWAMFRPMTTWPFDFQPWKGLKQPHKIHIQSGATRRLKCFLCSLGRNLIISSLDESIYSRELIMPYNSLWHEVLLSYSSFSETCPFARCRLDQALIEEIALKRYQSPASQMICLNFNPAW